jgi:nucleoside-diphosphate-sugar epimerase
MAAKQLSVTAQAGLRRYPDHAMKKIAFVTGASGFLGHHLVSTLNTAGWEVVALVRSPDKARALGARLVQGDLSSLAHPERVLPERVDAFFHIAANISMWRGDAAQQRLDNVVGTELALEAALSRRAQRFVFTSTSAVWGLTHTSFDERSERRGAAADIPYVSSKLAAEASVLAACARGLSALIVNPGHIVGAHDAAGWSQIFQQLKSGSLPGAPPGVASWCHAPAVARAQLAAATHGEIGANYLLGGADASYLTATQTAASLIAAKAPRSVVPAALLKMSAGASALGARLTGKPPAVSPELARILCGRLLFSSARAERELGYAPDSLEHMFEACHRWLIAEHKLS